MPALGLAAALVAVVALARLGVHDEPTRPITLTVGPTSTAVAEAATPTPEAGGVFLRTFAPPQIAFLTPTAFEAASTAWPDRFADGIPSVIDGTEVRRVNEALNIATASPDGHSGILLIGGWYSGSATVAPGCHEGSRTPCPPGKIADSPLNIRDEGVALDGHMGSGGGPIVISGVARTRCAPPVGDRLVYLCLYGITADHIVWRGDAFTATGPIGVMPLLDRLSGAFDQFAPEPYHDAPGCTLPRPPQTYRSTAGAVQLVFVFRSTDERFEQATAVLNGPPFGDPASGCDARDPLDGKAGWVSGDNVMVRVDNYAGASGKKDRQLLTSLTASGTR